MLEATQTDEQLRKAELDLKIAEATLKQNELARGFWGRFTYSPIAPIVVTAILGFAVTQMTNQWNHSATIAAEKERHKSSIELEKEKLKLNVELEREKTKSTLIVKSIETGNPESSSKNLLFLLDTKLIDDPTGTISALRTNPERGPVLAGSSSPAPERARTAGSILLDRISPIISAQVQPDKDCDPDSNSGIPRCLGGSSPEPPSIMVHRTALDLMVAYARILADLAERKSTADLKISIAAAANAAGMLVTRTGAGVPIVSLSILAPQIQALTEKLEAQRTGQIVRQSLITDRETIKALLKVLEEGTINMYEVYKTKRQLNRIDALVAQDRASADAIVEDIKRYHAALEAYVLLLRTSAGQLDTLAEDAEKPVQANPKAIEESRKRADDDRAEVERLLGTVLLLNEAHSQPAAKKAASTSPLSPLPQSFTLLVFFNKDDPSLSQQALNTIKEAAAAFKSKSNARITATGHTDTSGPEAYNMALSLRCANAVKDALVREGVPAQAITVIGMGEKRLLVQTADNVREPQNRRVEIVIE